MTKLHFYMGGESSDRLIEKIKRRKRKYLVYNRVKTGNQKSSNIEK